MRRARHFACIVALALAGCADLPPTASARLALGTSDLATAVGAIEVLVLDGADPTCRHALMGASPLDDPSLDIVAHALFAVDGEPKHLSIPAGKKLVFYAEAFDSPAVGRARLGRGCAEQMLSAGASAPITIVISAGE
jgi:hypothetical protein